MQQNGTTFPGTSYLLQQTTDISNGLAPGGLSDALSAGVALAARSGPARPRGAAFGLGQDVINAPQGNGGTVWTQQIGATTAAAIAAEAITQTEAESGGDFDASIFTYTCVPYSENAQESSDLSQRTHLEQGDMCFCDTVVQGKYLLYNVLNVAQLNDTLRKNHATHRMSLFKEEPENVKFQRYMERYGEATLNVFHYHKKEGTLRLLFNAAGMSGAGDAAEALQGEDPNVNEALDALRGVSRTTGWREIASEMNDFHKMAQTKDLFALTKFGIMSHWNFIGIMRTSLDPDRVTGRQQFGYARTLSIGVVTKGNFEGALQLWPLVNAQSKLSLVLTREFGDQGHGPFQIFPYADSVRESIPKALLTYRDESGQLCEGHRINVGVVNLPPNKQADKSKRWMAAGIISQTPHQAREAASTLTQHNGMMRVIVRGH